jgi:hypothetical protein
MAKGLFSKWLSKSTVADKALDDSAARAVSTRSEVADFLARVDALPATQADARLLFGLDATASRQPTWDSASQLQAHMFSEAHKLGGLAVQLCYFRGFGEFRATPWHDNAAPVLDTMQGLRCQAGATQIGRLLAHALIEHKTKPVACVVYIGDCLEESLDSLAELAGQMGLRSLPLFAFQEGGDPVAAAGFKELCRLSGGAYGRFDADSADQLRALLQAVAAYAAGGRKGLLALGARDASSSKIVALLENQLPKV